MTRSEFIKLCALLGISTPFQSVLASPIFDDHSKNNFKGNVIIIGAGAAGLTAGHLLSQLGIDFQILEANSVHGGRMRTNSDFVDFPIPLGGEWLHVERGVLHEIVNDTSMNIDIETKAYDLKSDRALYEGNEVSLKDLGFGIDQKFIGSSWFDFFDTYILPSVKDKIAFNTIIKSIDYSGDKLIITSGQKKYETDKIILTVPVKLLQNNAISFTPKLPDYKLSALNKVKVWDGFKAFIEFSEKFYPTAIGFKITPRGAGQKLYYDAAYGQQSNHNILGLFSVGTGTLPYRELADDELIEFILKELDEIFNGKASTTYIKHMSQNWNEEPFAQGAYVNDQENWRRVRALGESVNNKLYFAGTSYTDGEDWSSIHTAARSAIRAVKEITT